MLGTLSCVVFVKNRMAYWCVKGHKLSVVNTTMCCCVYIPTSIQEKFDAPSINWLPNLFKHYKA